MSSVSLFLDTRRPGSSGECRFRLLVSHMGSNAMITLDASCRPDEWDGVKVVRRPDRTSMTSYVQGRLYDAREALMQVSKSGTIRSMSARGLRDRIMDIMDPKPVSSPLLEPYVREVASRKSEHTADNYMSMLSHLRRYDHDLPHRTIDSVDRRYLLGFVDYLRSVVSPNSVTAYMRILSAVFNSAIEDELTASYPFKGIHCRKVPTAKRNLSLEQMRSIASLRLPGRDAFYRDMFLLSFMLIGMNTKDMYLAKPMTSTGRVDYVRAKTGKQYSIKAHPKAVQVIRSYPSSTSLFASGCASLDGFRGALSRALHRIGERIGVPGLSMYYARHTWASMASELDVSHDTIARALGHGGNTVTDIYIAYDYRKVDEANRLVIEHVFGPI